MNIHVKYWLYNFSSYLLWNSGLFCLKTPCLFFSHKIKKPQITRISMEKDVEAQWQGVFCWLVRSVSCGGNEPVEMSNRRVRFHCLTYLFFFPIGCIEFWPFLWIEVLLLGSWSTRNLLPILITHLYTCNECYAIAILFDFNFFEGLALSF